MNEKLARLNGLLAEDFQPKDWNRLDEDALCELAELLAAQENAIVELAELIGGKNG